MPAAARRRDRGARRRASRPVEHSGHPSSGRVVSATQQTRAYASPQQKAGEKCGLESPAMARGTRSRLSILACGALLLLVAWRLQVRSSPRSSARSGPEPAPIVEGRGATDRDLSWDAQQGGHTLARHVGRSANDLAERLEREGGIAAASTFLDRRTAERVVGLTLSRNQDRVSSWLRRARTNLTLDYRGTVGQTIGWVLLRGESTPRAASDARVVLRQRGGRYFVLTSYPVEP